MAQDREDKDREQVEEWVEEGGVEEEEDWGVTCRDRGRVEIVSARHAGPGFRMGLGCPVIRLSALNVGRRWSKVERINPVFSSLIPGISMRTEDGRRKILGRNLFPLMSLVRMMLS